MGALWRTTTVVIQAPLGQLNNFTEQKVEQFKTRFQNKPDDTEGSLDAGVNCLYVLTS